MDGPRLPGATVDDERIICHVDMDCFYASCERLREPELRGEPVVVGMGYEPGERHGAVATASYEAREHGVASAQPIRQALEALPRIEDVSSEGEDVPADHEGAAGHYRPVDLPFYRTVAEEVKEILHDCADTVREVSIDEAYLDVTDRTGWDVVDDADAGGEGDDDTGATGDGRTLAEGYARYVKQRIDRAVGVSASVGVAPNMSTAKVASDFDKPDGLTVVRPGEVRSFLAPLPVEAVHGVGPVTASELAEEGIETAGDLAAADPAVLADRFGERGRDLYARARGEDDREVTPTGRPKSLSRESAFTEATADPAAKREVVSELAADVAARARRRGALYRTIGIKVVTPPFEVNTRASSLSGPVDDPALLERIALDLLGEFADDRVRKLGVRVSNLAFATGEQAQLDGFESAGEGMATTNREASRRSRGPGREREATLTDWLEADVDGRVDADEARAERRRSAREGQSSLGEFD